MEKKKTKRRNKIRTTPAQRPTLLVAAKIRSDEKEKIILRIYIYSVYPFLILRKNSHWQKKKKWNEKKYTKLKKNKQMFVGGFVSGP